MAEQTGVEETSPTPLAEAIASSPEALNEPTQEAQDPTAEQGGTQEKLEQSEEPRVPYSRLKEVVDEKNFWREKAMQQQPPQQPQQPTQDPFAGMTPEEEKFFRMIDARAEKIAEAKVRQISPVIDAGRMELAQIKVQQFRDAHPDIKANSPEEVAIAERISNGYLPEDAYKVVMWDNKVAQAEKQGSINNKKIIEAKKQANVEQHSIPQGGTAPTKEKLTLRQRIERDAANMDFS